jgi:hypothetical protein
MVEPKRGVFVWKDADAEVDRWAGKEGMNLLPIFGYTPKWASSGPNGENSYPPKDLHDWSDFVFRMVSRYKDRVKAWEVWNEPNIAFWTGSIEEYADLMKSACVAAKKADPGCKILLGGVAGFDPQYLKRIYGYGCEPYFDIMGVHPYQFDDKFNDGYFVSQLRDLHRLMAEHGDAQKEIWLTELGWSNGDPKITEPVQARLLAQCFITSLTLRDANVAKTFWFSIKDWGGPGFGLLRDNGTPKPALGAYSVVAESLEGADYIRSLPMGDMRCYLFRKAGKPILAVWQDGKPDAVLTLPSGFGWSRIRRLTGKAETVDTKCTSVSVSPEPSFIFGESSIAPVSADSQDMRRTGYRLDVWCGVVPAEGTSRPYIIRGRPSHIAVSLHNDSERAASVKLEGRIGAFRSRADKISLAPGEIRRAVLEFTLPVNFAQDLATAQIRATADGKALAPIDLPVRISDGPMIEFLTNSFVETRYLVENNASGGAPSMRFSGNWTYKFDLTGMSSAVLDLDVGAYMAQQWKVLFSRDKTNWKVAASGRSNRTWHTIDASEYAGGPLYVKFDGGNQQLGELILRMRGK